MLAALEMTVFEREQRRTILICPTFHYDFPSIGHKGPKDRVQVQNRPIDLIPTIFRKDITAWICQNLATKHLQ